MNPFNFHVLEIGPIRALETPAVRKIGKFQAHRIVHIGLKFNTAHFDHDIFLHLIFLIAKEVTPHKKQKYVIEPHRGTD